ncbi:MAG: alpha-L-rhamnosidase family protein [Akkermansiaceae bacterium]|nr:alpha-L-rhamnosidase family protein [Akkermansiaceae bacterium]
MNILRLFIALFFLIPATLPALEPPAQSNVPLEIAFTARQPHADPFNTVVLDVTFTDPAGTSRKVPAFWAGGDRWKVRYASPLTGLHRWQSTCSDPADEGLHAVAGSVEIAAYTGDNPLFQHGPVRVATDKRHFEHADGTPFFWLGDTWWMGLCSRMSWPEDFQKLTADRKAKGFNVVQIVAGLYPDMNPFDPRGANEAGFPWQPDYTAIRPEYFDAADTRLRYLTGQGMTPCIVGAWGYFMPWMGPEKLKAHWRYLIARYGSYPVIWCAAGEANLPWYRAANFPSDDRAQVHGWTEVLRSIRATDPFRRPLTIHPTAINRYTARNATDDEALLDFDLLQTPHGQREAVPVAVKATRDTYGATPAMPVINGEASYEMLNDSLPTAWTRAMFWLCTVNGAKGHTYGANGIWQVNRPGQPHGPSPTANSSPTGYGVITWEEAMNLPGSTQMGLGKRFFESLPWTQLTPMPESVAWAEGDPGDPLTAPQACGIGEELRAVYVLDPRAIVVRKLAPAGKYQLIHFDPVTGERTTPVELTADANGDYRCEPPSHGHDWVLLITKKP